MNKLDEATAALRLVEAQEMNAGSTQPLSEGSSGAGQRVLITDVHAWKAGLGVSVGVTPVCNLKELGEDGVK